MTPEEKLAIAVQALKDIANPLDKIQRTMKPGYKLDGQMTALLCNNADHLKKEAIEALRVLEGIELAPAQKGLDGGGF